MYSSTSACASDWSRFARVQVSSKESVDMARRLARGEGLLVAS